MFAYVLVVIIIAIAVSAIAERRGFQPALMVASVGLAASYIPGIPHLELPPQVILGIILPPILFSAARDFSFAEFRRRSPTIINLGVLLVFVSTVAAAGAALLVLPGMLPLAALILGAAIAPPDAVTAIAVGRRAGLPVGLMTVLKGESLINDAAALTIFAVLVAMATGTHAFIENVPVYFIYVASVGILIGFFVGTLAHRANRRLQNPELATALMVLVPFVAYLVAEELHASGVLAVVAAGFTVGHHAVQSGYRRRLQEQAFWRTADTLIEAFVFAYIGLQLRSVITEAAEDGYRLWDLLLAAGAIFVAIVAARFAWVFATAGLTGWRQRRRPPAVAPLGRSELIVLSFAGMRGVVTLAAAAGTPLMVGDGSDFPDREAIISLAFLVTVMTLLVQGLTLPSLINRLHLDDQHHRRFATNQRARAEAMIRETALAVLANYRVSHPTEAGRQLAAKMEMRLRADDPRMEQAGAFDPQEAVALGQVLLTERRNRLVQARDNLELDDTIVREMLEKLDIEQAFMDSVTAGDDGPP